MEAGGAAVLDWAPSPAERDRLLAALEQGLQDRGASRAHFGVGTLLTPFAAAEAKRDPGRVEKVAPVLADRLTAQWKDDTADPVFLRLMMRLGHPPAQDRALTLATDPHTSADRRLAMLGVLGEVGTPACALPLLGLLAGREPEAIQSAALAALWRFDQEAILTAILGNYSRLGPRLRTQARELLLSRKGWALALLREVDEGKYPAAEVPVEQLRPLSSFKDRRLDDLVRKHWGSVQAGTAEEKLAEVRRLSNDLRAGAADVRAGREVYRKACATCHRLFDEGERVGPDLTHANRKDRDYLLVSIVDPSAVIRKEYLSYVVQTTDGRVLTGLIAEEKPGSVTVVSAKNERVTLPRNRIESLQESPTSLMPDNLLKDLRPQELRDLFGYLQSDGPLPRK
jgi:putative heme-binding domain-containing protein